MSESAAPFVPDGADLDQLRAAAAACKGCHLWENATQTVFSRGSAGARYRIGSPPAVRITVSPLGRADIVPLASAVAGALRGTRGLSA